MMKFSTMMLAAAAGGATAVQVASADSRQLVKASGSSNSNKSGVKKMLAAALLMSAGSVSAQENAYEPNMCNTLDCVRNCRLSLSSECGKIFVGDDRGVCAPIFWEWKWATPELVQDCFFNVPGRNVQCEEELFSYPCSRIFNRWSLGLNNLKSEYEHDDANSTSKDPLEASTNTTSEDSAGEKLQAAASSSCPGANGPHGDRHSTECEAECQTKNPHLTQSCCKVVYHPITFYPECCCSPNGGQSLCKCPRSTDPFSA